MFPKVCNKFDEKEEKFRNFECLLFQTDSLEIMHQWKLELGLHRIEFVLLDAQNYPFFFDEIVLNQTHRNRSKISQIFLYKIKHVTLNYGLHKLIVLNGEKILGLHRFMILRSVSEDETVHLTSQSFETIGSRAKNNRYSTLIDRLIAENILFFTKNTDNLEEIWSISGSCLHRTRHVKQLKEKKRKLSSSKFNQICEKLTYCDEVNWSIDNLQTRFIFWCEKIKRNKANRTRNDNLNNHKWSIFNTIFFLAVIIVIFVSFDLETCSNLSL